MVHKNNTMHQITWRHKSPENMALHRECARKSMKKAYDLKNLYDWNRISKIFLRILL